MRWAQRVDPDGKQKVVRYETPDECVEQIQRMIDTYAVHVVTMARIPSPMGVDHVVVVYEQD